jgi:hypothetical protein
MDKAAPAAWLYPSTSKKGDWIMKRMFALAALTIVLGVTAMAQTSAFAKGASCKACCHDKCGDSCCKDGCTDNCCQSK